MTAETITNTIGHILKFFVPPIINLLALSLIVGFGLGLQSSSPAVFNGMKENLSAYYGKISIWIPQTIGLIFPNISTEMLAKFSPQTIVLNLVSQVESAGGWVLLASIVMLLFIAITLNYITLWISRATNFLTKPFCRLCCNIAFRLIDRMATSQSTTLNRFSLWLRGILNGPFASDHSIKCARAAFARFTLSRDLSEQEMHGAVRARLSREADPNLWLEGHQSLLEKDRAAKNLELYLRIYCSVSVVVTIYALWHLLFQISVLLPFLLFFAWTGARLASIRAARAVYVYDLNEFLYYQISEASRDDDRWSSAGGKAT